VIDFNRTGIRFRDAQPSDSICSHHARSFPTPDCLTCCGVLAEQWVSADVQPVILLGWDVAW
jgi:hypothetical protein